MSRFFDGSDDNISLGSPALLDNLYKAPFTVGFWLRVITAAGYFISKLDTAIFAGWVIFKVGTNGFSYWCYWNDSAASSRSTADNAYTLNKWFYVTCTTNGGTDPTNYHNYVNGVLNDGATTTGSDTKNDAALNLKIGSSHSNTNYSNINMAYLQMWKRVLSVGEIKQSMHFPGSIRNGLVGFWPFWGSSSPEPDLSGNGNNGTVAGAIKGTTEPPINGIFQVPKPELITSF